MVFTVTPDTDHPQITNEGMIYEGQRYRVACALAGKPHGHPFGLDIAFADPIFGEPDVIKTADTLAFAGIPPTSVQVYPLETHIAEKLHAYTIPRPRPTRESKTYPTSRFSPGFATSIRRIFEQPLIRPSHRARRTRCPLRYRSPPRVGRRRTHAWLSKTNFSGKTSAR
jgi:hypothetical protein